MGITLFVVALLASILLHELGHLLTAKKFGMKATQYFLGFGPTLWSTRRGETEYGVKAIPAGGFVKIVGMTQLEELAPEDEPRAFWRQPARRRFVVLVAGSTMHFIIALLLVPIALFAFGDRAQTLTIGKVSECVPVSETANGCTGADPRSPAIGVLQPGDQVLAFEGTTVSKWTEFTKAIRAHGAGPVDVTIRRGGQVLHVHPSLVSVLRTPLDATDAKARPTAVGALGVTAKTTIVHPTLGVGLSKTANVYGQYVTGTFKGIAALPAAIPKAFGQAFNHDRRDEHSAIGVVGVARISGQALEQDGVATFLLYIAFFNVFIGIVNLLPLLPLDGGHVAVLLFEKARSALARALGRRDPGRVDLRKLMPVATLVVAVLAGLTVLMVFADINNPIIPG